MSFSALSLLPTRLRNNGGRYQPIITDDEVPFGRVALFARHAVKLVVSALPTAVTPAHLVSEVWGNDTWQAMVQLQPTKIGEASYTKEKKEEIDVSPCLHVSPLVWIACCLAVRGAPICALCWVVYRSC